VLEISLDALIPSSRETALGVGLELFSSYVELVERIVALLLGEDEVAQ
jgi:hypothetical protein